MTTATEDRHVVSTANRVEKRRSISYEWEVGTVPATDYESEKTVLAVLTVSYSKAGPNYFSGTTQADNRFKATLGNETVSHRINGSGEKVGDARGFTLFSAVGIASLPAGARFSAKKLQEAARDGYVAFREAYESGDERVLRYFAPGGYKA